MNDWREAVKGVYHTNVAKDPNVLFAIDKKGPCPKIVGVSRDGKFRSFAYVPKGGCDTNAKRSIIREYKEYRLHV